MTEAARDVRVALLRALVVPLVVMLAGAVYLLASEALSVRESARQAVEAPRHLPLSPWKARYSRQFPGCVAAVLWPGQETPQAVVVRAPDGSVRRVERGPGPRWVSRSDGRIIGACYR